MASSDATASMTVIRTVESSDRGEYLYQWLGRIALPWMITQFIALEAIRDWTRVALFHILWNVMIGLFVTWLMIERFDSVLRLEGRIKWPSGVSVPSCSSEIGRVYRVILIIQAGSMILYLILFGTHIGRLNLSLISWSFLLHFLCIQWMVLETALEWAAARVASVHARLGSRAKLLFERTGDRCCGIAILNRVLSLRGIGIDFVDMSWKPFPFRGWMACMQYWGEDDDPVATHQAVVAENILRFPDPWLGSANRRIVKVELCANDNPMVLEDRVIGLTQCNSEQDRILMNVMKRTPREIADIVWLAREATRTMHKWIPDLDLHAALPPLPTRRLEWNVPSADLLPLVEFFQSLIRHDDACRLAERYPRLQAHPCSLLVVSVTPSDASREGLFDSTLERDPHEPDRVTLRLDFLGNVVKP